MAYSLLIYYGCIELTDVTRIAKIEESNREASEISNLRSELNIHGTKDYSQ